MYGFPINSQGGLETFTGNADSGFPKIQQREVFYSIKDGLWNDTSVWQTASGRVGLLPTANDDVYIRNYVTLNTATQQCNNLYIAFYATLDGGGSSVNKSFNIYGNLNCPGNIKMTTNFVNFILYGTNNFIDNLSEQIPGYATFSYARTGDQPIMPLNANITIIGVGTKYLIADTTCKTMSLTIGTLDAGNFNLTITGTCQMNGGGFCKLAKTGPGKIIFNNTWSFNNGVSVDFSGNPDIEFTSGGINGGLSSFNYFDSGIGTWKFSTNNQSIQGTISTGFYINAPIIISNGITLTIGGAAGLTVVYLNNTINGDNPSSKLLMNVNGSLFFNSLTSINSMTIGTWDFTTNANTIGYTGNYSATIPSYFTTFHNLTISGTGTKSLGVNTTLNGNLASSGTFELSTYDLIVTGTTTTTGGTGYVSKNSSGNILFIGAVYLGNGAGAGGFNFSGNPNVEFRNGITTNNNGTMVMGSGNYSFTTNNQTIFLYPGGTYSYPNATIVGAITVTWTGGSLGVSQNALSGFVINPIGTTASSKLVNNGNIFFNGIPSAVMSTGIFDITTNTNNVTYNYNGDDTLPFTTYSSLTINGSGTKTLSGNTTINGSLNLPGNSLILECSTYNLSVNGSMGGQPSPSFPGKISKTGSGSLLFVGNVSTNTINWVLTGNPTIEFRNGLILSNINTSIHNMGTGQITFSTNNQNITWNNTLTFNNNILISGAITVTQGSTLYNTSTIMNGVLNGDNASSKWLMGTLTNSMTYNNATQPMATGILDTSTNLNTWIYGGTNQDIKGGPTTGAKQVYRNLRLSTSGSTKTLQGYVSVLNTYTLDSGVTVNNNGYTLTNP